MINPTSTSAGSAYVWTGTDALCWKSLPEPVEGNDGTNEPVMINPTPASAGSAYVWTAVGADLW